MHTLWKRKSRKNMLSTIIIFVTLLYSGNAHQGLKALLEHWMLSKMDKVSFSRIIFEAEGGWLFCISFGIRMKPEQIPFLNMWHLTLSNTATEYWTMNAERQ